jgi:DNA mismatch repair protein MutL
MRVRRLVSQAIRETLLAFHKNGAQQSAAAVSLRAVPNSSPAPEPTLWSDAKQTVPMPPVATTVAPKERDERSTPAAETGGISGELPMQPGVRQTAPPNPTISFGSTDSRHARPTGDLEVQSETAAGVESIPILPPPMPIPLLQVPMRLLGVVGRLYVVLESDRGLVLLDQHAAHERILFEQMLNRLEQKQQADSQKLLLPETVELAVRDANFLKGQLETLTRLGVGLSEFGERTFLLDALPPFVKAGDPRRFVLELVDELKAAGQEVNALRLGEHVIAKTVCRHAVKANDPLTGRELENLVEDLRRCAMPYTCPHGRPTLVEMNFRELEKKFGRSQ